MSTDTQLDVRWPIGLLFLAIGFVVALYGLSAHPEVPGGLDRGVNLDLVWGVVLVLFGAFMIWGARRASRRQQDAERPAGKGAQSA